jgi:ADP-ribose pyrophosphatase
MSFQVVHSSRVYEGKVFDLRVDIVRNPEGREMQVDIVEHSGAVVILPFDSDGKLWFVRQYRHPTEKVLLEFPAGTLENGEDPRECAIRECREEIGMMPGEIAELGGFYLAPGYSTEYLHVYSATDLSPSPLEPDADEAFEIERLSLEQIRAKIDSNEIEDAKTLASLYLLSTKKIS